MGSDIDRIRKLVVGLPFDKKYELVSQALGKENSDEEVKEIYSCLTPQETLQVRSRAFRETANGCCRGMLAKNHFIITKEQQSRDMLGMFAISAMAHVFLDESEKILKDFEELFKLEKEMAYSSYSEFKQREKEHWQHVFEYLEKLQRLQLRFTDKKAFQKMLKEPDEQKRLEYIPFMKAFKKAISDSLEFEEEHIQEAKQLMKSGGVWKPEYEGQNPRKWITEGIDELAEILHKPQEQ